VLICLPLVAAETSDLLKVARASVSLEPDLLEWRLDTYQLVTDVPACLDALAALRDVVGDLPLILTCRRYQEGGSTRISADQRRQLIGAAIQTGDLDLVDIELSNHDDFIQTIMDTAKARHVKTILSFHNFDSTPPKDFLYDRFFQACNMGADIAKVAVMPSNFKDVLTLMDATLSARENGLKIPMISISMGDQGRITRAAGSLFGSDITFANSGTTSAPGQISIQNLRQAMAALSPAENG